MTQTKKPFSESPLGYVVAGLVGTFTGGPFAALTAPAVLHLVNKQIDAPAEGKKISKRWLSWAGIGVLGAPASALAFGLAMAPFVDTSETQKAEVKETVKVEVAAKAPEPKPEPTVAPVQEEVAFNCDVTDPDQKCAHSLTADQLRTEAEAKLFLDRAGNISGMCFGNYSQYYKKTCSYFM